MLGKSFLTALKVSISIEKSRFGMLVMEICCCNIYDFSNSKFQKTEIFGIFKFQISQNFPISAGISKKFAKIFNFSKNLREFPKICHRFSISKISEIHFLRPRYCFGKDSFEFYNGKPFRGNILDSKNVSQIFWK